VNTAAPEHAGRPPAERGAEGTDRPATQGQAGSGTPLQPTPPTPANEREV